MHSWNDGAGKDEGDPPPVKSYDDKLRYVPRFNNYHHNPTYGHPRRPLRSRPVRRWVYYDEDEEPQVW